LKLPWNTELRPIGLDVGTRVIKLAQVDSSGGRITAAARIPRPEGAGAALSEQEAMLIASSLPRLGFVGSDVALTVHPTKLLATVMDLPPASSGAPVVDIARAELARIHKLDATLLDVGMWTLPPGPRQKPNEAPPSMVVGCRRPETEAMLAPLDHAGLTCVRVDATASALTRAFGGGAVGGASLVLDIGASATNATVLVGRTPIFDRRVPDAGLGVLFAQVADAFELENDDVSRIIELYGCTGDEHAPGAPEIASMVRAHADLVVRELQTSLAYVAHRYPDLVVAEAVVIGGGASIPGMVERLTELSGLPGRVLGWAELGVAPNNAGGLPSQLALAIGLARGGVVVKEAA